MISCALGRAVTCHLLSYGRVASHVAVRARAQLLKEADSRSNRVGSRRGAVWSARAARARSAASPKRPLRVCGFDPTRGVSITVNILLLLALPQRRRGFLPSDELRAFGGAAYFIRLRRGRNPYEVQRLREEETKLPLKRRPTACLLTAVHADWAAHCRSTQADAI